MLNKIHFISYGNHIFNNSKKRLGDKAVNSGWFHTITIYGPENLSKEFKNEFDNILQKPRGAGY